MAKTRLLILGSTGSIGRQTLDVVSAEPEEFEVVGLTAHRNEELLREQAERFGVKDWVVTGENEQTLVDEVERVDAELVVVAVTGTAGLAPTLAAIHAGLDVALANKEALVMGGEEIMNEARQRGVQLFPIDSEHSALFQLLQKVERRNVKKIVLTCSGGPFWGKTLEELENVSVEDALRHPTWKMGPKITIDSATWINKGFEIIEAHHLFGFAYDDIEVVVHPQSIVHGMVKLRDGTKWFHASPPDMRIPIHAALHGMNPQADGCGRFEKEIVVGKLTEALPEWGFYPPQKSPLYRGIEIALRAAKKGPAACAALVRADEEAVKGFLEGKIGFLDIYERLKTISP